MPRRTIESPVQFRREREALVAEKARALDGRVFQHRITGEVRGAAWREDGIEFVDPKARKAFLRPHRKALQWCENADDITPRPEPLPAEVPALPVAEDAIGGRS